MTDLRWRKSSFSLAGECVEIADLGQTDVLVRNSKHPEAGTIRFGAGAFAAWVAGIKAGEFDWSTR